MTCLGNEMVVAESNVVNIIHGYGNVRAFVYCVIGPRYKIIQQEQRIKVCEQIYLDCQNNRNDCLPPPRASHTNTYIN